MLDEKHGGPAGGPPGQVSFLLPKLLASSWSGRFCGRRASPRARARIRHTSGAPTGASSQQHRDTCWALTLTSPDRPPSWRPAQAPRVQGLRARLWEPRTSGPVDKPCAGHLRGDAGHGRGLGWRHLLGCRHVAPGQSGPQLTTNAVAVCACCG